VQLPDSYEALHQRAVESVNGDDLGPAIQQFQRLTERLLALSPQVRERKLVLQEILEDSAMRWVTALRWSGKSEDALAQVHRLREALPMMERAWQIEEALNRIDLGEVSVGLDQLRAVLMQMKEGRNAVRMLLANELLSAGLDDEAETVVTGALRSAESDEERVEALSFLMEMETGRDRPDAMVAYWRQAEKRLDERYVNPIYERLSAGGHWEQLEALLAEEKNGLMRRLFQGEIARNKGDEAQARELWQSIADAGEKVKTEADAYAWITAKILLGHGLDVLSLAAGRYQNSLNESSALLALVAAQAQADRLDEAKQILERSLRMTHILRPKWQTYPLSYWLRLLRYPLTDQARETLVPYFRTGENTEEANGET
jgi:tetratricopeptide (TPR) repeat protein